MQYTSIDRPNLSEFIGEYIKKRIFEQKLHPGEKIAEDEIARALGTSRTPVKIALTDLAKGGIVELLPRRGAYVREFSRTDILELYEIRQAFEGLAGRLSARHIGDEELEELEKLNANYQKLSTEDLDSSRIVATTLGKAKNFDLKFHRVIVRATGNRHLAELMKLDMIEFLSFLLGDPSNDPKRVLSRTAADHCAIIDAFRRRDEEEAEILSKQHILRAMESLK